MWGWLKAFGGLIKKALSLAGKVVPEETMVIALAFVREAAARYTDNAQRREWVVQQLQARGVPESIARLAVELAVRLFKAQLARSQTQLEF